MEQTFFFVDGVHADRASKRLMRRHVMKGKNAGKTFKRQSRLSLQVAQRHTLTRIARPVISNPFRTFRFPVEVTPIAGKAIDDFFNLTSDSIYPVQLGFSLHEAKRKWLQILFEDQPTYECTLTLMQASNETFLGAGDDSPTALHNLSQTLAQFQKRLGGRDALADSTIAIVISLIHQEQVAQHLSAAEVHVRGLKRIVDLRGGLDQIHENVPLVLKICKTDILFTMQKGGLPLFYRDQMYDVQNLLLSRGFCFDRSSDAYSVRQNRLDPVLQDILSDSMGICRLYNKHMTEQPLTLDEFQEVLVSICYRLLWFRTLDESRQKSDIQSAYHIGLVVFMMSIFLQDKQRRMIKYGLMAVCVRDVLDSELDEHEQELKLWLMILGGIWVSGDEGEDWAVSRLQDMALGLGITTWDEAREYISKFPLIDAIHDVPGRKIWDQVAHLIGALKSVGPE
ncbi:hypothetical protein FALBO_7621 [Fusarium albosuccineum]|uniref:Uncharacterized protein n=1 Tax=Fusarium albosuccineum TaxID=1237068 RepID=A0A8H4LCI4_9HYPO|nr:hypothetical protein FALBO_7621 [Fusarium albosuccineum]